MAQEYGGSDQEPGPNGGNNAVPVRQLGADVNLNYSILPVPTEEAGSVDAAGVRLNERVRVLAQSNQ